MLHSPPAAAKPIYLRAVSAVVLATWFELCRQSNADRQDLTQPTCLNALSAGCCTSQGRAEKQDPIKPTCQSALSADCQYALTHGAQCQ